VGPQAWGAVHRAHLAEQLHPVEHQGVGALEHRPELHEREAGVARHVHVAHARVLVERQLGGRHRRVEELLDRVGVEPRRQVADVQAARAAGQRRLLLEHRGQHRRLLHCSHGVGARGRRGAGRRDIARRVHVPHLGAAAAALLLLRVRRPRPAPVAVAVAVAVAGALTRSGARHSAPR
jgi:hypothetical protein